MAGLWLTVRRCSKWIGVPLVVFAAVHVLLGVLLCEKLPHSRYRQFCPAWGQDSDRYLAHQRTVRAAEYLESFNKTSKLLVGRKLKARLSPPGASDVCVAVVTVMRQVVPLHRQYIFQVLHAMLPEVLADRGVALLVVNAERVVEAHTALRQFAAFVPTHHVEPAAVADDEAAAAMSHSPYLKERYDYGHALLACARLKPRFIVVLEDDAVPLAGFLLSLRHLINNTLLQYTVNGGHTQDWAYAKLYYPGRWSGFQNDDTPALVAGSLFVGAVIVAVGTLAQSLPFTLSPRSWRLAVRSFRWDMLLPCWLLVLSVLWMINKHHLDNLRLYGMPLHAATTPADPCCTPAVLYRARAAEELGEYLLDHANAADMAPTIDLAMSSFAEAQKWTTCAVRPNLAEHRGRLSTLPKIIKDDVF